MSAYFTIAVTFYLKLFYYIKYLEYLFRKKI